MGSCYIAQDRERGQDTTKMYIEETQKCMAKKKAVRNAENHSRLLRTAPSLLQLGQA